MVERQNIFPESLSKRIVKGHVLYTPVVTVVPGKLVFVSGILSRNAKGEIVGKGDMAAQIRQVFANIQTALAAAGATMADIVKRQTFTTELDGVMALDHEVGDGVLRVLCDEVCDGRSIAMTFDGTEFVTDGTYKRAVGQEGNFVREGYGLGLGVLRVKGFVTFLSSTTPVDEENVHVRWVFTSPLSAGEGVVQMAADSFTEGVSQDIPIWENKIYQPRPVLTKGEKQILEHRKWSRQFYSNYDPVDELIDPTHPQGSTNT